MIVTEKTHNKMIIQMTIHTRREVKRRSIMIMNRRMSKKIILKLISLVRNLNNLNWIEKKRK